MYKSGPSITISICWAVVDAISTYRKSKDPRHNPVQAFDNCLSQTKALLENNNEYSPDNLTELLSYLLIEDDIVVWNHLMKFQTHYYLF
jgi:hypothetical protein